jgi:hypothetical protein
MNRNADRHPPCLRIRLLCALAGIALALSACKEPPPSFEPSTEVAPSHTAFTRDTLRAQLAQAAEFAATLEGQVGVLFPQLSPRKRELLAKQTAWMFAAPAFAERLYERVAPLANDDTRSADVHAQAGALGALVMARGMARLGVDDQARFVRKTLDFLRHVDATSCRAALDGTLHPERASQLEMAFNVSRSDAEFEQDVALQGLALRAELETSAPLPKLGPQQEQAAEAAMQRAFAERRRLPANRLEFERFDRAAPGLEADADACWFGLQYIDAMLSDVHGEARTWQLQRYVSALAGE